MNEIIEGFQLSKNQVERWDRLQHADMIGGYYIQLRRLQNISNREISSAIMKIVSKHETLRTVFKKMPTMTIPVQSVSDPLKLPLFYEGQFIEIIKSMTDTPWGSDDSGIKVYICDNSAQIIIKFHPLCFDKKSILKFIVDLFSEVNGSSISEDVIQYIDVAQWEFEQGFDANSDNQKLSEEVIYAQLPFKETNDLLHGAYHAYENSFDCKEALVVCKAENISIKSFLESAILIALSRYKYIKDGILSVGYEYEYRSFKEFENSIGPFSKITTTNFSIEPTESYLSVCRNTYEVILSHENKSKEFPNSRIHRNAVSISYSDFSACNSDKNFEFIDCGTVVPETDFHISILYFGGYAKFKIEYLTTHYSQQNVETFLNSIKHLLVQACAFPQLQISKYQILTLTEFNELVVKFNDTDAHVDERLIHQLFERQVISQPEAPAIYFDDRIVTYAELNILSNRVGRFLISESESAQYIGVLMNRCPEMIGSIIGILKSGKAYLPLDHNLPSERISWLINNQKIDTIILNKEIYEKFKHEIAFKKVLIIDDYQNIGDGIFNFESLSGHADTNINLQFDWSNIAYTIFTSGTTGTPKGVMVSHQPVINVLTWVNHHLDVNSSDCILFITSLGFDLSVYDIFGTLAAGAALQIVSDKDLKSPDSIINFLCNGKVTIWDSAPGALSQLLPLFPSRNDLQKSSLRQVMLSGDWIPVSLPDQIRLHFPCAKLISLGGATEATVWSNYYDITSVDLFRPSIPYGRPIQNARYYVLNENLLPCPKGVEGELYIGGKCLAQGYYNDIELTNSKFISDPFSTDLHAKMYKTGDLARHHMDGHLEIIGRIDSQVKIRGYRIELGEIDSNLRKIEKLDECITLVKKDANDNRSLVSFYISNYELDINLIKYKLSRFLPKYMVPEFYVRVEQFPVTNNGKIDRNRLLEIEKIKREQTNLYIEPRNSTESKIHEIWKSVLGIDRISIDSSFTSVGGDSISGMTIVAECKRSQLNITPQIFLQNDTIEKLAQQVGLGDQNMKSHSQVIEGEIPLLPNRFWYFKRTTDLHLWSQYKIFKYTKGTLNTQAVEQAIRAVINHHDALRATFYQEDGKWIEKIVKTDQISPVETYLHYDQGYENHLYESNLDQISSELCLAKQLIKIGVFKFSSDRPDELLVLIHHLVMDAYSLKILYEDITKAIDAAHRAVPISLPKTGTTIKEWAEAHRLEANLPSFEQYVRYWESRPWELIEELPTDYPYSKNLMRFNTSTQDFLSKEETIKFYQLTTKLCGVDEMAVLLLCLSKSINTWCKAKTNSIELVTHGRTGFDQRYDVTRTVGWFNDFIPFIISLDEMKELGIAESLQLITKNVSECLSIGKTFGALKYLNENQNINRALSKIPDSLVAFNYIPPSLDISSQSKNAIDFNPIEETELVEVNGKNRERMHLMTCQVKKIGGQLSIQFFYSGGVYRESTMTGLSNIFVNELKSITSCIYDEI